MRTSHPETSTWISFVEGGVAGITRRRMEEHLGECRSCRRTETRIRRVLTVLASAPAEPAPATAVRAALSAFGSTPWPARVPSWTRGLARRVARLVFDSLSVPDELFAGVRSAAGARRLRLEVENLELDLLVESRGERRRLTAQLLALGRNVRPIADADVFVAVAGQVVATGATDRQGHLTAELDARGPIEIVVGADGCCNRFRVPPSHPPDLGAQ